MFSGGAVYDRPFFGGFDNKRAVMDRAYRNPLVSN